MRSPSAAAQFRLLQVLQQVEQVGGRVWVRADELVPLDRDWIGVFRN